MSLAMKTRNVDGEVFSVSYTGSSEEKNPSIIPNGVDPYDLLVTSPDAVKV